MLDKIGTLLKAQYRAEKTGKIGTFLCRLAPNYMRFHLVEWSFVRRHKKEWGCRYVLASLIIAVSVMLNGGMCDFISGFSTGCKKLFSL